MTQLKRHWAWIGLLVLIGALLITSQALAAPAAKKTPPPDQPGAPSVSSPGEQNRDKGQGQDGSQGGQSDQDKGKDKDKQNNGNADKSKGQSKGQDKQNNGSADESKGQDGGDCEQNPPDSADKGQGQAKKEDCEDKKGQQKQTFRGEVTSVSETTLTITLPSGEQITFDISGMKIHIPSLGKHVSWKDLAQHAQVIVHAVTQDGDLRAVSLNVVPGKPSMVHAAGAVEAYDANQHTITVNGQTYALDEATKIVPTGAEITTGAQVTVILKRDVTGGAPVVRAIVVRK